MCDHRAGKYNPFLFCTDFGYEFQSDKYDHMYDHKATLLGRESHTRHSVQIAQLKYWSDIRLAA
jgi:hypothetical protein